MGLRLRKTTNNRSINLYRVYKMSLMCYLFGHNFCLISRFGMQAYCTKCGETLVIRDPIQLQIGERRYIDENLYEQTQVGLELVKPEEET